LTKHTATGSLAEQLWQTEEPRDLNVLEFQIHEFVISLKLADIAVRESKQVEAAEKKVKDMAGAAAVGRHCPYRGEFSPS
jgi:hypothetical protein